jgi:CubicO group peptidase (beta-lactamase class C family)
MCSTLRYRCLAICLLLLGALAFLPYDLKAQSEDFFKSAGKKVHIEKFDQEVLKMMNDIGIPGLSLAVIENNRVVYSKGYGIKDMEGNIPMTDNTVFEAASLSKPYLAYVVLQLVEGGKFDLDKPMYEYMPMKALEHDDRYKQITPRMILSHSSGIENWRWNNDPNILQIMSEPGTAYEYSGEGYNYLADIIENVVGKPYENYVRQMIIDPFGFQNTYTHFEKDSLQEPVSMTPSDFAYGYSTFYDQRFKQINEDPVPSSANIVNAEDYANFILKFFDGKYFDKQTREIFLKPVVPIHPENPMHTRNLIFEMTRDEGETVIAHTGSNSGFKSGIFYSVENKRGFVYFANYNRGYAVGKHLSELTAGVDVGPFVSNAFFEQYPSSAIDLLKVYREDGSEALLSKVNSYEKATDLQEDVINEVADEILSRDVPLTIQILNKNLQLHPGSATSYFYLGLAYMRTCDYEQARNYLSKSLEMGFDKWGIRNQLAVAESGIKDQKEREDNINLLSYDTKIITADNFNGMCGVYLPPVQEGEQQNLRMGPQDMVWYNLQVQNSGLYMITLDAYNFSGVGQFDVYIGPDKVLTRNINNDIASVNEKLQMKMQLDAGIHSFKIIMNEGRFNFKNITVDFMGEVD